jgi:hypothetical protein
VILVDSDAQIDTTKKKNFYNMKTSRLVMGDLKTDRFYTYDFVLNATAKRYIDLYLTKTKKNPGDKLFNLTGSKMSSDVKKGLGIGNREFRRAFQNIYEKIFKVPLSNMSNPMAHDLETANSTYLDTYTYTEPERKKALAAIKAQIALNATAKNISAT